jgi:hypothetical protein
MAQPTTPAAAPPVAVRLSARQSAALAEAQAKIEEARAVRLDALGMTLTKSRKDAIDGRIALGIDKQWEEDTEFYEGIDDANREEMKAGSSSWASKPPGQTMAPASPGEVRSNVFVNITRPYCDSAAAKISDMLMPTDDRAFSLTATPVADLADLAKGKLSQSVKVSILQQMGPNATQDQLAPVVKQSMEKAQAEMAEAKARAEKAQTRLDDWFVECQFHAEARKVIDSCSRIGTGVIKGPIPVKRKSQVVDNQDGVPTLVVKTEIKPASKHVDAKNLFPDPACGENIHNGSFIWERDHITRKKLDDLKGTPGYLEGQIDKCLAEGPQKAEIADANGKQEQQDIKDRFEIWYYHGIIDKEDIEALGCKCDDHEVVHGVLTMVNNRVIKGSLNHLDTGEFPYDVMVWQSISGRWAGIGVSRQIRTPQRMVNAATRNMMDNAGLSAGPQIVIRLGVVTPADGKMAISPRKIWYISEGADLTDVKQAFSVFNIDSKQAELKAIIDFGMKLAEDVTGLPLLMQGQLGNAPDTLGGQQLANNNAGVVLRRLAKGYDDSITEPHVRRYYVWLMQYGEDDEKGDYQIDARGSSALVERELENQTIVEMGQIVTNPAFGVNPKKWFGEYCKSKHLDPKKFQYTEEEQAQIDEMAKNGPSDPRVAVAQIRADLEKGLAQFKDQSTTRLTMLQQQFDGQQQERDRQTQIFITEISNASKESTSLADLKERLANVAIKVNAQRELSARSGAIDLHKHSTPQAVTPPTEPAGRADRGRSFQQ